jgi:hypothetical protein
MSHFSFGDTSTTIPPFTYADTSITMPPFYLRRYVHDNVNILPSPTCSSQRLHFTFVDRSITTTPFSPSARRPPQCHHFTFDDTSIAMSPFTVADTSITVPPKVKWWHCDGRISEGKLMAL